MVENLSQQRRTCFGCGSEITANNVEGLCAQCLLGVAVDRPFDSTVDGETPTHPQNADQVTAEDIARLADSVPHYEFQQIIGAGGMGRVYRARQLSLDRDVAIKVLALRESDPAFAERFRQEAQTLAKLNHPNVVKVHDFGQSSVGNYIVMEHIQGLSFAQAIRADRAPVETAINIVQEVCHALEYAHTAGIVHRDIKPGNILLDDHLSQVESDFAWDREYSVKVVDFGIARLISHAPEDISLTNVNDVMGTPQYMAPEQRHDPKGVDHRADIYSIGVLFYELLTGKLPQGRFPLPSEMVDVDPRIDELVERCLQRDPNDRYASIQSFNAELTHVRATCRPARQRRIALMTSALIVCLAGLAAAYFSGAFEPVADPAAGEPGQVDATDGAFARSKFVQMDDEGHVHIRGTPDPDRFRIHQNGTSLGIWWNGNPIKDFVAEIPLDSIKKISVETFEQRDVVHFMTLDLPHAIEIDIDLNDGDDLLVVDRGTKGAFSVKGNRGNDQIYIVADDSTKFEINGGGDEDDQLIVDTQHGDFARDDGRCAHLKPTDGQLLLENEPVVTHQRIVVRYYNGRAPWQHPLLPVMTNPNDKRGQEFVTPIDLVVLQNRRNTQYVIPEVSDVDPAIPPAATENRAETIFGDVDGDNDIDNDDMAIMIEALEESSRSIRPPKP